MPKHISIHKAEFHHVFYINSEENEDLLDDILSVDKFIYPLKDKNQYYLYDVESGTILNKKNEVQSVNIDSDTDIISFIGVGPDIIAEMPIPKNVKTLKFEGGDLMSFQLGKTKQGEDLWNKVINNLYLYKFVETIDERISVEKELRDIYNNKIPNNIGEYGLDELIQKIDKSKINELIIGWTYFSDFDFQILSKLKQLETLSILYCYNDNIKWLPKNLTYLKIFGTTLQNLSEVNINLPALIHLDLEGNSINKLDNLKMLPETLDTLCLGKNLIQLFDINDLPEELEFLDLSHNLISNDFFNQKAIHKNLKYLILNSNKLVVTSSILHLILEIFPNLESLELLDNKTDGVPAEFLGDYDNKNCLENVEFFLEGIKFTPNGEELSISKFTNQNQFIEVKWQEKTLPLKPLLADIQFNFSKHFIKMPFFSQHVNGIYCLIEHDNCELLIHFEEKSKEITFKVQSDKPNIVALYFHKYFQEVNSIISLNSHVNIWPSIINSKYCGFLKDFCNKALKMDYKIKSIPVLRQANKNIEILINNSKVDEGGKFSGQKYESAKNVAFILVSGKSAYPFVIKNGVLTNALKLHRDLHYSLTLRTAFDKESYSKGITSKYLNSYSLIERTVFIDYNVKKKVSCFVNKNHFEVKDNIIYAVNLEFPKLDEDYLKEVKMDNGKYCEFSIDNQIIELKYVD